MAVKVSEVIKKVCMLGDPAVGKTSLVHRFVFDLFDDKYLATIGTKIMKKTMVLQYPENAFEVRLTMLIWDITGHKRHMSIHPAYYEGAEGAFIVGDATRPETINNMRNWVEGFKPLVGKVPMVFLVNKTDLVVPGPLDTTRIEEIAKEYGSIYRLTSAKTGENVEKAFTVLGEYLVRDIVEARGRPSP
jgi:small GTP-binding protein